MSEINLDAFRWFVPKPQNPLVITIPNLERISFNSKLLEKLPSYITIGISSDGHQLAICEKEDGYKLLKSGSIKNKELVKEIATLGVRLPAKYAVTIKDNGWLATLETQGTPPVSTKSITRTPQKKNLSGLQAELEGRI